MCVREEPSVWCLCLYEVVCSLANLVQTSSFQKRIVFWCNQQSRGMRRCNSWPLTASLERAFEKEARRYGFTQDPDIPISLCGVNDATDIRVCMDELFWAAWPCVSQWLKEQRQMHSICKWRSRKLLSVVWNAWVDQTSPPLVSDSDSMPGATHDDPSDDLSDDSSDDELFWGPLPDLHQNRGGHLESYTRLLLMIYMDQGHS